MANKNITLKDKNNNSLFPKTFDYNVFNDDNQSLDNVLLSKANTSDLLLKADTNLSNVTYPQISPDGVAHTGAGDRVVESYVSSDGLTWYRKWASGWKECGGYSSNTLSNYLKTIALPIEFSNKNYVTNVTLVGLGSGEDTYVYWVMDAGTYPKTTSSFIVRSRTNIATMYYHCCGY